AFCAESHVGRYGWALASCIWLTACSVQLPGREPAALSVEAMSADQLVQTDFNRTLTLAMRDNLVSIVGLLDKLYKRNPREWRRAGHKSHDDAVAAVRRLIETQRPPRGLEGL